MLLFITISLITVNASFAHDNDTNIDESINSGKIINNDINENLIINNVNNVKNNKSSTDDKITDYNQLKNKLDNKNDQTLSLATKTFAVDEPITTYNSNLEIQGNGAIFDGKSSNAFIIFGGKSLKINNVTFKNFKATSNAVISTSTSTKLTLVNCNFINITGQNKGAAVTNRGSMNISNCVFENNQATKGSAITSIGNGFTNYIQNSTFKNNKIVNEKEPVLDITGSQNFHINNCIFENNYGRSIHCYLNVNITVNNSKFINMNHKHDINPQGSILDNYESNMYLYNNKFDNINVTAPRIGGGLIYNEIGKFVMENNTFSRISINVPDKNSRVAGGILWNRNSTATIKHNSFDISTTSYNLLGGVLYNNIGILNVTNNTFKENARVENELAGGIIYNDHDSAINVKSKLYYGDNSFDGLKILTNPKILNKTIRNMGEIYLTGKENIPMNKTAIITITAPVKVDTGQKATFNITVIDKDTKKLLNGTVIIKLNGISLTDSLSNPILIKIVNGKGNVTYTLKSYSAKEYTVTAVFSKSGYNRAENTTKMTVNKVNYVMEPITFNACSEKEIVINTTVKDTNGNLVSGNNKVAIKINGKTILSTTVVDGKLYSKVKLPYLPSGKLNLTIYLGNNYRYNFKQINSTIYIYKQDLTATIEHITNKRGQKIQIKAKLLNNETKTNVISGQYAFKVDSKTIPLIENNKEVFTTKIVSNGIATWDYIIPTNMTVGTHYITLVYNGNKQTNSARITQKVLTVTG